MRYTFKNSGVLNLGEPVSIIGHEEYSKRYHDAVPKALVKLGQLEDIEEELGIDLLILFKALKNGAYIPFYGQVMSLERYKFDFPNKRFIAKYFNGNEWEETLYFKDYGKTWALDKNDLTNE